MHDRDFRRPVLAIIAALQLLSIASGSFLRVRKVSAFGNALAQGLSNISKYGRIGQGCGFRLLSTAHCGIGNPPTTPRLLPVTVLGFESTGTRASEKAVNLDRALIHDWETPRLLQESCYARPKATELATCGCTCHLRRLPCEVQRQSIPFEGWTRRSWSQLPWRLKLP